MPRNYLVTIRAHPTEYQIFEDFFSLFLVWLNKKTNHYYYSIEEDNTPARHAHCFINDNAKDMDKFHKKIKNNFRDYFKKIEDCHTKLDSKFLTGFINVEYVTDDNIAIGYVFKGNNSRIHVGQLQSHEIQECVNAYWISKKTDSRKMSKDTPIRLLNTKNAHGYIQNYCTTNNCSVKSRDLKYRMEKDFHSFDNISPQNVNRIFRTMRIMLDQEEEDDKYNSCCEVTVTKDTDYEIRLREEHIEELLKIIYSSINYLDDKEIHHVDQIKKNYHIHID